MKLAEALLLRSDMEKKLASLRERINRNVLVQEEEDPAEDPQALIRDSFSVMDELEGMVRKINLTNSKAALDDGRSLLDLLAQRDTLARRHSLLQAAIGSTHRETDRYSMSEIKWITVIDVAGTQKQADDLARKIRDLNVVIQETNWKTELIE